MIGQQHGILDTLGPASGDMVEITKRFGVTGERALQVSILASAVVDCRVATDYRDISNAKRFLSDEFVCMFGLTASELAKELGFGGMLWKRGVAKFVAKIDERLKQMERLETSMGFVDVIGAINASGLPWVSWESIKHKLLVGLGANFDECDTPTEETARLSDLQHYENIVACSLNECKKQKLVSVRGGGENREVSRHWDTRYFGSKEHSRTRKPKVDEKQACVFGDAE